MLLVGLFLLLRGLCVSAKLDLEKMITEIERDESIGLSGELKIAPIEPQEGLIFVKTHQTGGSTLVNILHRNLCETRKILFLNGTQHIKRGRNCFLLNISGALDLGKAILHVKTSKP